MSVIVEGSIGPIQASDIRIPDSVTIEVPLNDPSIHVPQLESLTPLIVKDATLEHARKCAQRLVANMGSLPANEQAADLLSMAFAILHFTKEKS